MKDIWGDISPFSCEGPRPPGRSQGSECSRVISMAQRHQIRGLIHSPGWELNVATGWPWGHAAVGGLHLTGWDSRISPKRKAKSCLPSSILPRTKKENWWLCVWWFFCLVVFFWFGFVLFVFCALFFLLPSQRLLLLSSHFFDQSTSKKLHTYQFCFWLFTFFFYKKPVHS